MDISCSAPDIFVGTEKGILKGIFLNQNAFRNYSDGHFGDGNPSEVSCMCHVSDDTEVLCGMVNRQLKLFDSVTQTYTTVLQCEGDNGNLKSVAVSQSNLVTAEESGCVKLWNLSGSEMLKFDAAENLCKMRACETNPTIIATGGKENPLKLWDINGPCEKPTFTTKNVRPNFLEIRQPIWVTDIQFLPDARRIITCTGHHQIRIYDPKIQRRPVVEFVYGDKPLTCISLTPKEHTVIAGNTEGSLALFDIRGRGNLVQVYKGFAGSITGVQCHSQRPLVATCSLDRFVRVHNIESRELLHKVYVKSRSTCLLFNSNNSSASEEYMEDENKPHVKAATCSNDSNSDDDVWNEIAEISQQSKRRLKRKQQGGDAAFSPMKKSSTKVTSRRKLKDEEQSEKQVDKKRRKTSLHPNKHSRNESPEMPRCTSKKLKKSSAKHRRSPSTELDSSLSATNSRCLPIPNLLPKKLRSK